MSINIDTYNRIQKVQQVQLAQLTPASANTAELLFTLPDDNVEARVTAWSVASHNNQDVTIQIYFDASGTTWTDNTLAFVGKVSRDTATPAGDLKLFLTDFSGSLAFEASDVDCTITIWGDLIPKT